MGVLCQAGGELWFLSGIANHVALAFPTATVALDMSTHTDG